MSVEHSHKCNGDLSAAPVNMMLDNKIADAGDCLYIHVDW